MAHHANVSVTEDLLWQLPGPRRFANGLESDLEQGRSALLLVPATLDTGGLAQAVRAGARTSWQELPLGELVRPDMPPAWILYEMLRLGERAAGQAIDITDLLESESLGGRFVWVDATRSAPDTPVGRWLDFVTEYAAAAKNLPAYRRASFITVLSGELVESAWMRATEVDVRWWWSVIDRIDTAVYVDERARGLDWLPTSRAVVTEVCAFDVDLVDLLVDTWDRSSEGLRALLESYGNRFDPLPPDALTLPVAPSRPPTEMITDWCAGRVGYWDGRARIHAAVKATDGLDRLHGLIWSAQIRTVFPEIERLRSELARWASRYADLVPERWRGVDIMAMEVGPLRDLIAATRELRSHRERLNLSSWLSTARNDLAHTRPLEPSQLRRGNDLAKAAGFGGV